MKPSGVSIMFLVSLFAPTLLPRSKAVAVPSGWRKPTSDDSRSKRINTTQALINTVTPLINGSSGETGGLVYYQSANLLCALSLNDLITQSNKSLDIVSSSLVNAEQLNPGFYDSRNSDSVMWGLAAMYAYRAFQKQYLLDIAVGVWNSISVYQITQDQANAGKHPSVSLTLKSQCNGASIAGGVLWFSPPPGVVYSDAEVNGETAAAFMTLSAYLFEATQDNKYSSAAQLAATFIKNHMYNGTVVFDTIFLDTCSIRNLLMTYNQGLYIEGLAVLGYSTNNDTWISLMNDLIANSIVFPAWTGSDGIITEGPSADEAFDNNFNYTVKAMYIRGLREAYTRSSSDSGVAALIKGFITVQYNALLDLASIPGSNQYSSRWLGPPMALLTPWGQLAAMDVMNSAISIADSTLNNTMPSGGSLPSTTIAESSALPEPTGMEGNSQPKPKTSRTPMIIGISVGILVFAVIVLVLGWRFHKKKSTQARASTAPVDEPNVSQLDATPFDLNSSFYNGASKSSRPHRSLPDHREDELHSDNPPSNGSATNPLRSPLDSDLQEMTQVTDVPQSVSSNRALELAIPSQGRTLESTALESNDGTSDGRASDTAPPPYVA